MKLTIELDREVDGRWIAEVAEVNVVLYAQSKEDAIERAQQAAREIVLDRIAHDELPPHAANAVFDIGARVLGPRRRRVVSRRVAANRAAL